MEAHRTALRGRRRQRSRRRQNPSAYFAAAGLPSRLSTAGRADVWPRGSRRHRPGFWTPMCVMDPEPLRRRPGSGSRARSSQWKTSGRTEPGRPSVRASEAHRLVGDCETMTFARTAGPDGRRRLGSGGRSNRSVGWTPDHVENVRCRANRNATVFSCSNSWIRPPPVQRVRPRSSSILRRSRLVGRPAPRSRSANTATSGRRSGGGGEWSTKQSTATDAPTRLVIGRTTSTIRCRRASRASIRSPTFTAVDGLATLPPTSTWPPRHAAAASARVLVRRTDHNHWSTRADSPISTVCHSPGSDPAVARRLFGTAKYFSHRG